jgi:integrase
MGRRRGNSEGTVFQDKHGLWWAQLPPDDQGRRPKRSAPTQREALALLRQLQAERSKGLVLSDVRPTVERFAEIWLAQHVERTRKASTTSGYGYILRHYIIPRIGRLRIDQVTHARVQQLINELADAGYAPSTVHNAYLRLSALLDAAVKYPYIDRNPAEGVDLPSIGEVPDRTLSWQEVQRVLELAEHFRNGLIYHLLLGLGLRRGESLGLRWQDINWEEQTFTVRQQVQEYGGKLVISAPKTKGSERTLPLTDEQITRLRAHWERQQRERQLNGATWQEHDLVFATEVGTPTRPGNLNRQFDLLRTRAGLSLRLHDLRHTFATLLADLEVEERVISAMLGHTPGTVTRRYAKTTLAQKRAAVEKLAAKLRSAL